MEKLDSDDTMFFGQELSSPLLPPLDAGPKCTAVWKATDHALGHPGPVSNALFDRDAFKFSVLKFFALEKAF